MDGGLHALCDVDELHARLRAQLAATDLLTVADVRRAFLEVSSLPCDKRLWSLEFGFDEDDGRIARLAATFAERHVAAPTANDLVGYEVHVLLPRILTPGSPQDASALLAGGAGFGTAEGLVARFLRALADLGAYRSIERLLVRSVDVFAL